ncbi:MULTISPECIES: transcriptional regulator [Bacillus]|uniref:Transcriptional regulator n=1 Tax=Bacillus pseudomycoides TaxID=64104 RepID=A0A1Y3M866_9BACI|nr:transcriptional regulator [Bacillus pseudomycoides]MDF2086279.1 transcriptional regulator [Bacillus pseudomycoides]OUM46608.1 transcriptional regulator [Bacillus pseudomycoides]
MKRKLPFYIIIILILVACNGCSKEKETNQHSNMKLEGINFNATIESTANRELLPNITSGGVHLGLSNSVSHY